jgi:hypothetical protein
MKKIFIFLITLVVCMAAILPTGATETYMGTDESTEILMGTESEISGVIETETAAETESAVTEITETETEDVAGLISGAGSRLEAIVAIAGAMGITLDEAEQVLDKMIAIGDEHFAENDRWGSIRADMLEHPETWIIVILVILMFLALITFLIRSLIKQTGTQASIKANVADIKKNEEAIGKLGEVLIKHVTEVLARIDTIEIENSELRDALALQSELIINAVSDVLSAVNGGVEQISNIERNSETSVKVNEEQALHTIQLLNIAMGRQLPNVSGATRKLWYEDAVNKIKAAAGKTEAKNDGRNEG